jgi:hypothetical protein
VKKPKRTIERDLQKKSPSQEESPSVIERQGHAPKRDADAFERDATHKRYIRAVDRGYGTEILNHHQSSQAVFALRVFAELIDKGEYVFDDGRIVLERKAS